MGRDGQYKPSVYTCINYLISSEKIASFSFGYEYEWNTRTRTVDQRVPRISLNLVATVHTKSHASSPPMRHT